MSSYTNLASVSRTLAHHIWNNIENDEYARTIIHSPKQIIYQIPREALTEPKLCVFLYNLAEIHSMRNQPQPKTTKSRTLLYLNLRYLIVPYTESAVEDQVLLGKVMQAFAQTPVLRGHPLHPCLREDGNELRVVLDVLALEDLNKLWSILHTPYKLCVSYSVFPIQINEPPSLGNQPVLGKPPLKPKKPGKTPLESHSRL